MAKWLFRSLKKAEHAMVHYSPSNLHRSKEFSLASPRKNLTCVVQLKALDNRSIGLSPNVPLCSYTRLGPGDLLVAPGGIPTTTADSTDPLSKGKRRQLRAVRRGGTLGNPALVAASAVVGRTLGTKP